ncbi:ArsR/SmtB family transcription factor [Chloroflexota bacterium]
MDDIDRAAIYRLHAGFCKNLADANRLLIINELSGSELSVGDLAQRLGLSQSNVSKHLALMRDYGLVLTRREGSNIYYSLSDPRIFQAIKLLKEVQADQIEKQRALAQSSA